LTINDVVLIRRLTLNFKAGFCALTGETGAGKSILLDALGLALGERSEASVVRKGAEQAQVSAAFDVPRSHPVHALLKEQGLEGGDEIILRRIVNADGRSRAFINDQPVSVSLLRQAGQMLVEIHGQFDTHGLLNQETHRVALDEYALIGNALSDLWAEYKQAENALSAARALAEKSRAEEEYLRSSLEALDELDPQEGEEESLSILRDRLMKREQVLGYCNTAHGAMGEAERAVNAAYRALQRLGDDAAPLLEALDRAGAEIGDVSLRIETISSDIEESDQSLEKIDDRLHSLRGMARRHGCLVAMLPTVREDLANRLTAIERADNTLADLIKQAEKTKAAWLEKARDVSAKRHVVAEKLDKLVAKELPPLKLDKARFVTEVMDLPEGEWGAHGIDRIRFLISTNPNTEAGLLSKVASGGELARVMLALKVVMSKAGNAGTLIFDEVDTGIGGATASAVGERLVRLSKTKQILVVTHSPQVAAQAAHHWIVRKSGGKDVETTVVPLPESMARREEIARMLSGETVSEEARAAADRLMQTGT
jgi:DNA repair protein RecN (Recombination protein N)